MAINTYSALRTAVAGNPGQSWSHRNDVLSNFDNFLALTEEEMYRGNNDVDGLRVRDMEVRYTASLSTSSRFLQLPDNFLEIRRIELEYSSSVFPLKWVTADALDEVASGSGRPLRYTITSQFEFDITPDVAYTIEAQYYQTLTPLSSTNTTHAILTRFPSLYLYGVMSNLYKWSGNVEKTQLFEGLFSKAIKKATDQDRWGRIGPGPQAVYQGSVA